MSELMQLQNQLQSYLLSGHSEIHDSIVQTPIVGLEIRLGIYRDAYKPRLIESLTANFPCLYAYLGTEEFNNLANSYIDTHPSTYRSIRWYGDVLPEFIKVYYTKYPYLAELAEFEWNMTLAFDASDTQIVRVEDMMTLPPSAWPNLKFMLHPSVHRSNYFWNTVTLWQALANEQKLPKLQQNSKTKAWVLWRAPEYTLQYYSLSPEESWALDSLSQGLSFGVLCEGLCEWIIPEEVGMRAASFLKGWIEKGMLSQLILE